MLNELLIIERGVRQAGLATVTLHPDVKQCGQIPRLLVRLDERGEIALLRPVPLEVKLWTLRNGQQNSFPFVQPKRPLLNLENDDEPRKKAVDRKTENRRAMVLQLGKEAGLSPEAVAEWPGKGLLRRLRERQRELAPLIGTDAGVVPATIERFLHACNPDLHSEHFLGALVRKLIAELEQAAQTDWLEAAVGLLLGKFNTQEKRWDCVAALVFEATGAPLSITDARVAGQVSRVLSAPRDSGSGATVRDVCALTGQAGPLLAGNFPQPNLPGLGQTYIFAKNEAIHANDRYGQFAAAAMPIGQETANLLAAALTALTDESRRDLTWRTTPGEAPRQTDLLIAFVEAVPEAPTAATFAELDEDADYSEEDTGIVGQAAASIAAFQKRTERLMEAVRARVGGDFRRTPVRLVLLRKVDQANRKVIYAGAPTVGELHDAAVNWIAGERNVPEWLRLPVFRKGEKRPRPMAPPHIAPLGLIPFSKQIFIRGGTERQELIGVPAADAFALFFGVGDSLRDLGKRPILRILRLVLKRRMSLVAGIAHAQRLGFDAMKESDRRKVLQTVTREVLRTITMLGLLLHKLGRTKEAYMGDTAFKLGQLLAAADVIHAGYCADVRGGSVPPSLLGNQVFTMAQNSPAKALATLCRRWKPYDGWARKAARDRERIDRMVASKKRDEEQRGWDIRVALRQAREMRPLADELRGSLAACVVDDAFRAELLLGYIAALPKVQEGEGGDFPESTKTTGREE